MSTEHQSHFALDVWYADGQPPDDVGAHVGGCARCAAYVAELAHLSAEAKPLSRSTARRMKVSTATLGPRTARSFSIAGGALAMAAAIVLFVRGQREEAYVGVKGVPAVQVLVRSADGTRIWDGRSSVHAGDALALHVACEQLAHVTVVAERASDVVRVTDATCPATPGPLPFTLVIDEEPGRERFSVVLTRSPVSDAKLRAVTRERTRDRDTWVSSFDLPKEPRP